MPKTKVEYTLTKSPNFDGWNLYDDIREKKEAWDKKNRKTITLPGKWARRAVLREVMRRGGNKTTVQMQIID